MADFDPIEQTSRYVFGETDSFYGVWDKQAATELLERFPLTEEGFEQASQRYDELKRRDRHERGIWISIVWGLMVAGFIISIVTGVLDGIYYLLDDPGSFPFELSAAFGSLGFRLAVGGLSLLAGIELVRRLRRPTDDVAADMTPATPLSWERAAVLIFFLAIAVWVASALALVVFPERFFLGPDTFRVPRGRIGVTLASIESVAFRIWVAMFAVLALVWARRWSSRSTAGANQIEK